MNIDLRIDKSIFNSVYYPYLLDYKNRFEVYYGGAASGKSHFIGQKLVIKALSAQRKILVIRKVMATQQTSCWQLIIDTLQYFRIFQYCKINKSTYTIELPNGSIFLFKGMDDSEKIKSIVGITDIWIEEASEISEEDFLQLNLRLRAKKSNLQLILSFNPVSKANWVYSYWFLNPKEETRIIHSTYKDNRFLPQSYIDSIEQLKTTNLTYYRVYALGEFASLDKLVYSNWEVQDFDKDSCLGVPLCGLDFGFVNDNTAFIYSQLDEESHTIYICKEFITKGKTNQQIAGALTSLGFRKATIICDSAEPKSIEELKHEGLTKARESVKGKDSIIHGIQKLQQYKLIVHPSCIETITELENYSWTKDKHTGEYINKPQDKFNHCLDALRYSLQCVKDNKLKTIDKSIYGF